MKITTILMLSLLLSLTAFSQDQSRKFPKNSISANILGTGAYLGFTYERYILKRYSAEVGIGLIGFGVGASYYFKKIKPKMWNPYLGLKYTSHAIVDGEHKKLTYLPVGITYFGNRTFIFGLDIGSAYRRHISPGYMPTPEELAQYPFSSFGIFGNLKLGVMF
jgi:hypothetical protein